MDVNLDIVVKDLVLDKRLRLGLIIPGVVCIDTDVVSINSNTRKSDNVKIDL